MEDKGKQELLDIIARQAKEIESLKQIIDALCRRIFGSKSEALDPAQLLLLLGEEDAKKPEAANVSEGDVPAAETFTRQGVPPQSKERLPMGIFCAE